MVVGILKLELLIPGNRSLKGKRQVLQKITQRARNRFNVSISVVDDENLLQRATIGVCVCGKDRKSIDSKLQAISDMVDEIGDARLIDEYRETLNV
jgi:hypothetical protein